MSHKSQDRDGALLGGTIPEQRLVEDILRHYDLIQDMAVDQCQVGGLNAVRTP